MFYGGPINSFRFIKWLFSIHPVQPTGLYINSQENQVELKGDIDFCDEIDTIF